MLKTFFIFGLILIILFLSLASGVIYFGYQMTVPLTKNGTDQVVVINKGQGIKEIGQKMEKMHLIRDSFYFEIYAFLFQKKNLQAGEYVFNSSMSISEIVESLVVGKVVRHEIKITIPEGFTLKQIDQKLTEAGLIQSGALINFDINKTQHLEGYLFPDTYFFGKDASLDEVVNKMLDNFDKKFDTGMKEEAARQNRTAEQIVILASIIQNEALNEEEMPLLSGVFSNRLKQNWPLQSDATVNYITGKGMRQAAIEDTKINSPYNTYQYKGLPPGPICNPGLAALKAAIWPVKTDYFYFFHPLDGPTIFSRTEQEHQANRAKWLK